MRCPYCGREEDKVTDSRPAQEGRAIRRRRECLHCGKRFTTYEYIERIPLTVIKRDRTREPYDREKLLRGIITACRKRPVGREEMERIVDSIESTLADEYKLEVESKELGEMVLKELRKVDEVSYVRFASVYRHFTNVHQFTKELERLRKEEKNGTS